MALWGLLLAVPIASVADLGLYIAQDMQVKLAAQAGAQAARRTCWGKTPPFVTSCTGLSSAVTAGIQSTAIGSAVTLQANYPKEGYYCPNASEVLTLVGTEGYVGSAPTKPNPYNCTSQVAANTTAPGSYVTVAVSAPYTPLFSSVSIAGMLPTTISKTAWMRMQ